MKVAVYCGSFNPLHKGHQAIMERLTRDGLFDIVYLVVSPKNPLKEGIGAESAADRYKAAVEAVARHPGLKVNVDDIELGMPAPQYTVRTLDALKEREPQNSFTLVIGADNLAIIRRWRSYKKILTEYGAAVYPRIGFDIEELRDSLLEECRRAHRKLYRITLLDAPRVDISSTEIREGLASGRDMSEWLM